MAQRVGLMGTDDKARAARKGTSLSDRLGELQGDASAKPPALPKTAAASAPPPLPSATSASEAAIKSPSSTRKANPSPAKPKPTTLPPPVPAQTKPEDKPHPKPKPKPKSKANPFDRTPDDEAERDEPEVPAGIRPEPRRTVDENEAGEEANGRRTAQRRPAGPSRERIAANDDAPSIGGLIYALNQRPSNRPFAYAAGATGLWTAIALGFAWAFMSDSIDWSAGLLGVVTHQAFLTATATLLGPIVLFWFLAFLMWRTEELHLRSSAMTEVAVRLAEPDRMAEQSVASLGQAVRRQVSFMNDAVTRALGRAGELEALVHNEVGNLEQSYEDNERKIRGLIKELAGERHALLNTGDRFKETLLQLGSEVPQLIQKLSSQQLKLAQIIEQAGSNLTQLESAIGGQTHKLETALGENTGRLQVVLEDYTGALATALGARTEEMQTMLTGYTEALGGALGARTQQMQGLLEHNREALDRSLGAMGDKLDSSVQGINATLDRSLETMDETLGQRTETMQLVFEEYARALDATLANRSEAFDSQLVERTKALDEAFGERLRLFDEAIMRSTLSIDSAVGDNAKALTSALEHHADSFNAALTDQAQELDSTLLRGIEAVRSTSENISRQSIKAIEGLAGQSDMLRNVSENLLNQISSVSNRFESQGHAIMRSANALESANYRIDKMLAERSNELNSTLDRMSSQADQLGSAFQGYSQNLEGSLTHAQEQARLLTQDLNRETEERARATVDNFERLRTEASLEADRALEDLRTEFASVSREVTQRLGALSDQFSQTSGEVRERAARAAQQLEDEQSRLKQQLDHLPQATEESANAMRRALQDQLKALDQLSALAQRSAREAAAMPPAEHPPIALQEIPPRQTREVTDAQHHGDPQHQGHPQRTTPLASLTSTLARELKDRQSRAGQQQQPADGRRQQPSAGAYPAASQNARRSGAPATSDRAGTGDGSGSWSFGDLLSRMPEDDADTDTPIADVAEVQTPEHAEPPAGEAASGIDIAAIAGALDRSMAAAIWSRFRSGQRGFMVPSIYKPEARPLFDDIVYRYQSQPAFRTNVDRFVQEFEQTLRDSDRQDPSGDLTQKQIVSDPGRVYLLFAHASQRLV